QTDRRAGQPPPRPEARHAPRVRRLPEDGPRRGPTPALLLHLARLPLRPRRHPPAPRPARGPRRGAPAAARPHQRMPPRAAGAGRAEVARPGVAAVPPGGGRYAAATAPRVARIS